MSDLTKIWTAMCGPPPATDHCHDCPDKNECRGERCVKWERRHEKNGDSYG